MLRHGTHTSSACPAVGLSPRPLHHAPRGARRPGLPAYPAAGPGDERPGGADPLVTGGPAGWDAGTPAGKIVEDALAGVRLLGERADVDPAEAGLWGFREGGWVAPPAAARSPEVSYVVLVGAYGVSPARQQTWHLDKRGGRCCGPCR
uniref:Uncharacterized protein n=1 Tax=Streptomyces sp. NBC_00049 TaxID=2903617 RepID=A0AAU2K2S8_9ACTN